MNSCPLDRLRSLLGTEAYENELPSANAVMEDVPFNMDCAPPMAEDVPFNVHHTHTTTETKAKANKAKLEKRHQKKLEKRTQANTERSRQLEQLRGYLGLATEAHPDKNPAVETVFVAVDVEVYERDHNIITEIGIAALQGRDFENVDPGPDGLYWLEKVSGRHFWIIEHSHLVNHEFVTGCPGRYEPQFGFTEYLSLQHAVKEFTDCFYDPGLITRCPPATLERQLNIVLVGHGIDSDIKYLKSIGVDLARAPNVVDVVDTAGIFRALTGTEQPRSLGSLLQEFGLAGWNLHNAGNDAAYTLRVMLAIAVRSASDTKASDGRCILGSDASAYQEER